MVGTGTLEIVNSDSTYFLRHGYPLTLEVDTKFSKLNLKVFKEVEESVSTVGRIFFWKP